VKRRRDFGSSEVKNDISDSNKRRIVLRTWRGRKNHSKPAEGKRNIWNVGEEEKDFGSHEVKKEL